MANPQAAALAQIDQWNKGNLAGAQPSAWGKVAAPTYAPKARSGLSKYLPVVGATAAGLAAAPFTGGLSLAGTLAALGAAGAVGSAAGEFGAEKFNHEKINAGSIAKQGAIGGALSAIPFGGVAKTAKVADTALAEGGGNAAGLLTRARGNIAMHGQQMEGRAGGFNVGSRVAGQQELNPSASVNISKILQNEKIPTGSPITRSFAVDNKLKGYGQQIDNIIQQNNPKLLKADRQAIADRYLKTINNTLGTDKETMSKAQDLANSFVGNRTIRNAATMNNAKRQLDKNVINYIKNPDSGLASKQAAAVTFRQALKDETNKLVPGLKQINNKYHDLSTAQGYLTKAANGTGRGGLINRVAESGPLQSAESKLGKVAQKVGNIPGDTTQATRGLKTTAVGELAKQGTGQPLASAILGSNQPQQPKSQTSLNSDPQQVDLTQGQDNTQQGSPYSLQAAMADIQRDPKHASTYEALYNMVDKATTAGGPNAAQQKNDLALSTAQSGLKSIDQAFQFAGGGQGVAGLASKVPVVGQYLPGPHYDPQKASAFNQTRIEVATQLATALTGSARPGEQVIMYYMHSLPNIDDRPDVAKYKLSILNNELANRTNAARSVFSGGSPTGQSQLTSALLGAQ